MSSAQFEIVPIRPYEDGVEAGRATNRETIAARCRELLEDRHLKPTLGQMSREELGRYAMARLEAPPDFGRYPELEDIYPERVDNLRGFAQGADISVQDAAVFSYLKYRREIDHWYHTYQLERDPGHCSGVLLIGPDGIIGGQSVESEPPTKPAGYQFKGWQPYNGLESLPPETPKLVLRKPRTGYIESWGVTNEKGVGAICGNSCGVWLDEPIEDTWPVHDFPLLRFARNVTHLEELYRRYTLHIWGRFSQIYADTGGNAIVVEKSYRRIGIRRLNGATALWCTEGHFESPEMGGYIRDRRLEYLEKAGKHLGAGDMQYATDCHVRFTRLAAMCHEDWGRGYDHIRRILTDHSTFPRAVCRHGGPDTAPYDTSVTMSSFFLDVTHNRSFRRDWDPWQRFCCEVPEKVTQYPARPAITG